MGEEIQEGGAQIQLRRDETAERRETDDRRVATACHRKMGEVVRQAPDAETALAPDAHHTGLHRRGRLGDGSLLRQRNDWHCRKSVRSPILRH